MEASLPKRRLIPRWRPIAQTLKNFESAPLRTIQTAKAFADEEMLQKSIGEWRENPTAGHLGDVLAFGLHSDLLPTVLDVAGKAILGAGQFTEVQATLIKSLSHSSSTDQDDLHQISLDSTSHTKSRVQDIRKLLSVAPGNVLALLDYAQLQLASGKQEAAERILRTAMALAPANKLVYRTAARFYVHIGDPEKAHALICALTKVRDDPWLISSEIALADAIDISSSLINRGKRLLKDKVWRPESISELAGAIASVELKAGQIKAARSSLRLALEKPNDNVVAQALVEHEFLGIRLDEPQMRLAISQASEARLIESWESVDAMAAEKYARLWHIEEPFSSRPIQFLTTLYSLQGNYHLAAKWVSVGLLADANDAGLLTNRAFTQAAIGRFAESERAIRKIRGNHGDIYEPFVVATEGLIAMKRGAFYAADQLYSRAVTEFEKRGQAKLAALCSGNHGRAAAEANHPNAEKIQEEAIVSIRKNPSHEAALLIKAEISGQPLIPKESGLRRLSQWVYDPFKNTLTQKSGITAKGAPGLIIKRDYNGSESI